MIATFLFSAPNEARANGGANPLPIILVGVGLGVVTMPLGFNTWSVSTQQRASSAWQGLGYIVGGFACLSGGLVLMANIIDPPSKISAFAEGPLALMYGGAHITMALLAGRVPAPRIVQLSPTVIRDLENRSSPGLIFNARF